MSDSPLLLPGDEEFEDTLATTLPLDWQQMAYVYGGNYGFVADSETGLLRTECFAGLQEYELGGEYEERLLTIEPEFDED